MSAPFAIYTRLSHDPTGAQTATARQERACRQFAAARGWAVGPVYEDVDLSAYRPGVIRPAFLRLMADVELGRLGGVLVWKLDRLMRRPSDFEAFWAICQAAGTAVASVTEPIDTSTEMGLAVVRILITFAHLESATRSVRLRAKYEENARRGLPHVTGMRGYGYARDMTVVPVEAERIREAARRLIGGESAAVIAADWNRRGIPRSSGKGYWDGSRLRVLMRSPRLAGHRTYHGEVVARDCWEPILDHLTFARVGAALATTAVLRAHRRPEDQLLGNLVFCHCGERYNVYGAPRGALVLAGQCHHFRVRLAGVTDRVVEALFERHPDATVREMAEPARPEPLALTEGHRQRLEQLRSDYYTTRTIPRAEYLARRNDLVMAFEAERRGSAGDSLLDVVDDPDLPLRIRWLGMAFHERRAVIHRYIARVRLFPGTVSNTIDRSRLEIAWWQDDSGAWSLQEERLAREEAPPIPGWLGIEEAMALAGGLTRATFMNQIGRYVTVRRAGGRNLYCEAELTDLVETLMVRPGSRYGQGGFGVVGPAPREGGG